ncbi:hypothetical protein AMS68_005450 [Peltaster fructicola]|uniref:Uncharacterized protein n=1 Tax=Peltaster fructicola TaxID=286661 RepID=A0A6H0XYU8_9PEZI|nr:hypothetical protein AMS68_005450 [Peltaster fructicola]
MTLCLMDSSSPQDVADGQTHIEATADGVLFQPEPPPLNYDLWSRKWWIIFFWSFVIFDTIICPVGLYFGLWYGLYVEGKMSANTVFTIVTAALGGAAIIDFVLRSYRLVWRTEYRVIDAKGRWTLDFFHWSFLGGWGVILVLLIASTVQDYPPPRVVAMCCPAMLYVFAIELFVLDLLRLFQIPSPIRLSSIPKGSQVRPCIYVLIEDIVAVDGSGTTEFRRALNVRSLIGLATTQAGGTALCCIAMKSKTSSRPQRRLTKLGKDKPVPAEGIYHTDVQPKYDDLPVRASYESLVLSSETRQLLREQLTATFPEAVSPSEPNSRWTSRDRLSMGRKEKKTPVVDIEEPSSPTLSFHTARGRLSTLPESTLDVEAAISLLQELKKKATPEELVALHRALLPVKEEAYEHDHATASEYRKQFATRRRSNLPPGLATRGGPEDDPLRRYGDVRRRPVSQHMDATPFVFTANPERSITPVDSSNGQAGVYRSGTLRITNGSASPTSSMHFRDSFEIEIQNAKEVTLLQTVVTPVEYPHKSSLDILDDTSSDDNSFMPPHSADEPVLVPALEPANAMDEYTEFCGSPYDREVSQHSRHSDSSGDDSLEQQFVTPRASMADILHRDDPPVPLLQIPTRPDLGHADSGYASEASILPAGTAAKEENKTPVKTALSEQRWLTALPKTDTDARSTTHSLYTFDQILGSPLPSSPMSLEQTPSPHAGKPGKRQGIFSSLGLSRSQSTKVLAESEVFTSRDSTPVEEPRTIKKAKSKKLKKAVPHHIRQARKELKRFEEAAEAESRQSVKTVPSLAEEADDVPDIEPIGGALKMRAPHAYARILAADVANNNVRRPSAETTDHDARRPSGDQSRDPQSSLSNATSDDTDGNSILNFRAVARSLGASPYDVSTSQFKSSIDYIAGSEDRWRIQSPFEIGQGIPGPKTLGMDEKAASELARKKSRDYIDLEQASSRPHGSRRPFSTNGQNMPPMPNLPPEFESKARKADRMVTRSSLTTASLPVIEVSPVEEDDHAVEQKSLASEKAAAAPAVDWTKQAKLWRQRRQALQGAESEDEEDTEPQMPSTAEILQQAKHSAIADEQPHEAHQQSEPARPIVTGDRHHQEHQLRPRTAEHAPVVPWQSFMRDMQPQAVQQVKLEMQLPVPTHIEREPTLPDVQQPTSINAEREPTLPDVQLPAVTSMERAPAMSSVQLPALTSVERALTRTPTRRPVGSGPRSVSGSKDRTLSIETARATSVSPAQTTLNNARAAIQQRMGSPVSPIGKGRLEVATRQRPLSQVSDGSVSPILSPTSQAPRGPRPPSMISLANTNGRFPADYLAKLNGATDEAQASTSRPQSASMATPDRYSGGLQYEWQRGVGIGGSAGTRANTSEGVARSMPSKVVYGLDLSDVPVFLTKQA